MCEQLDLFASANTDYAEQQQERVIERHSELTPRQWALYRLIYNNSLVLKRKTTQKEICDSIRGYEWNDSETAHDRCPAIWSDITANNLSFSHDKIGRASCRERVSISV